MYHPRTNDAGQKVWLKQPHRASALDAWTNAQHSACVVPDGAMVDALHGVPFAPFADAPVTAQGWERLADRERVDEPAFARPAGLQRAAGAVIREPDGRVWLVCPSNAFGGYRATFPKGRLDGKSAQATALCECFEEAGLRVRLLRWLVDVERSTTCTRYFLAERTSGRPTAMGWETQAVLLVPSAQLAASASHPNDAPIVTALQSVEE